MMKLSCPNKHCSDYDKVDGGNLTKYGKDRRGFQRYLCKSCSRTFALPEPPKYQPWQRKTPNKGIKSTRGRPELYDEVKGKTTFSLTPTAMKALAQAAEERNTNRSELVEQFARSLIPGLGTSKSKNA